MYVPRVLYEDCCSFQDINYQSSAQADSLFNLTQNYYFVISDNISTIPETSTETEEL